jgi:hypothetical protein
MTLKPVPQFGRPAPSATATPLGLSLALQLPEGLEEALPTLLAALQTMQTEIQELRSQQVQANQLNTRILNGLVAINRNLELLNEPRTRIPTRDKKGQIISIEERRG